MAALPHPRALARIDPRKNRDLTDDIFLGALSVDLVRAELPKCDANGSCDPYVVISMGNQTFKTKKQMKTRTPTWDLSFRFDVKSKKDSLHIECFDWDRFTKNDLIGIVDVPCEKFLPPSLKDLMGDHDTGRSRDIGVKDQMWLTLKKKGKRRGRILLKLKFDEGLATESETLSKGVPVLDINPASERANESDFAESDAEIEELNITIEDLDELDNGAPREEESQTRKLPSRSLFVETPATPRNSLARDEPEYETDMRPLGSKPVFDTTEVGELRLPNDGEGGDIGRASRVQSLTGVFAKLDALERDEVMKPPLQRMNTAPTFAIPGQVPRTESENATAATDRDNVRDFSRRAVGDLESKNDEGDERSDLNLEVVGKAMKILERDDKTPKFPTPTIDTKKVRKDLLSSLNNKLSAVRDNKSASDDNTRRERADSLLPAASDATRTAQRSILKELQLSANSDAKETRRVEVVAKEAALATIRSIKDAMNTHVAPLLRSPYAAPAVGAILVSVGAIVILRLGARTGPQAPAGGIQH